MKMVNPDWTIGINWSSTSEGGQMRKKARQPIVINSPGIKEPMVSKGVA